MIVRRLVPPWKRFLDVLSNKQSLQNILCEYVVSHAPHWLEKKHKTCTFLVVGGFVNGEVVKCTSSRSIQEERRFASTQEDADIRKLLHAGFTEADFAAHGVQETVVIRSQDTGVLVKMWLEICTISSTTDKRRFVPVHSICAVHMSWQ